MHIPPHYTAFHKQCYLLDPRVQYQWLRSVLPPKDSTQPVPKLQMHFLPQWSLQLPDRLRLIAKIVCSSSCLSRGGVSFPTLWLWADLLQLESDFVLLECSRSNIVRVLSFGFKKPCGFHFCTFGTLCHQMINLRVSLMWRLCGAEMSHPCKGSPSTELFWLLTTNTQMIPAKTRRTT